jgi:hypothetical protein
LDLYGTELITVEVACRSSGGWHFTVHSGINHTVHGMGFRSIGVLDVGLMTWVCAAWEYCVDVHIEDVPSMACMKHDISSAVKN